MAGTRFDNHGEVSLVPGDIHGKRAFVVKADGTLASPNQNWPWIDGVNQAECGIWTYCPEYWENEGPHHIAHPDCSCGFYAYFYERPNDYHYPSYNGTVEALVRSTGKATVGSYGFRAEKAEIVALVEPDPKDFKDDAPMGGKYRTELPEKPMPWWAKALRWVNRHEEGVFFTTIGAFVLTVAVAVGLSIWVAAPWAWLCMAGVPELVLGIGSLMWADEIPWAEYMPRTWYEPQYHASQLTTESWERVKQKYPSAKVYKTMKEAEAAHPMTFHPSTNLTNAEHIEEVKF